MNLNNYIMNAIKIIIIIGLMSIGFSCSSTKTCPTYSSIKYVKMDKKYKNFKGLKQQKQKYYKNFNK